MGSLPICFLLKKNCQIDLCLGYFPGNSRIHNSSPSLEDVGCEDSLDTTEGGVESAGGPHDEHGSLGGNSALFLFAYSSILCHQLSYKSEIYKFGSCDISCPGLESIKVESKNCEVEFARIDHISKIKSYIYYIRVRAEFHPR